ncbi:hypothetical protein BGZ80_010023 [Entomortierella chlamydospora]|uniref:FAD-binding domain-containing protein n=1 Tax=Entomortierella chlamydospora TaxID=101097 RepID=A0A9P6MVC3_9FUNG|nr:hypothetical protein BGZ79_006147 [Entomortierella chlamydospora]KAG0015148.1 hypothetical protein BGZ80_010023 [Entomortierella chlamydospora]
MTTPPHILIIGAGLAGLSLAQGLKRSGISFRVYERDPSPEFRAQGYRIRINHYGATALKKTLTEDMWQLFQKTCADTHLGMTGINAVDGTVTRSVAGTPRSDPSMMRLQMSIDEPIVGPFTADRKTLRNMLLLGLENDVEFGKKFSRFETNEMGQVTVIFEDGSQAQGSFLVGADGVRSAVRRQHIPRMKLVDTTCRCIYGKTPITPELTKSFPAEGLRWITAVKDSRPLTLFLEPVRFSSNLEEVSAGRLPIVQDYVYWVLGANQSVFDISDDELLGMSGREASALSLRLTQGWDEGVRSLLLNQSQEQTSAIRLLSTSPIMQVWEATPTVTFLGDAIHPMPPAGGSGANTALRDAANLLEAIKDGVTKSRIEEYERTMREYGGEAIAGSWSGGKSLLNMPSYEECETLVVEF